MLVFLDFDTQNDLVMPYGRYPAGDARSILNNLSNITSFLKGHRNSLHVAFKKINRLPTPQHSISAQNSGGEPIHCQPSSTGVEKVSESVSSHQSQPLYFNPKMPAPSVAEVVKSASRFDKPYLLVEHVEWNVFSNPRAYDFLVELYKSVDDVKFVLYGVPLDRTVFNFIKSAYSLDLPGELFLVTDAVHGYDKLASEKIFKQVADAVGVHLITTQELVNTSLKGATRTRKFKNDTSSANPSVQTVVTSATATELMELNKEVEKASVASLLNAERTDSPPPPERTKLDDVEDKLASLTLALEAQSKALADLTAKLAEKPSAKKGRPAKSKDEPATESASVETKFSE